MALAVAEVPPLLGGKVVLPESDTFTMMKTLDKAPLEFFCCFSLTLFYSILQFYRILDQFLRQAQDKSCPAGGVLIFVSNFCSIRAKNLE